MDFRTALLQVALNLFAAHGYDAVGVQTIAEQAGVTKPTLYHYFGSKEGLFDALITETSAPLLDAVRLASHYQGNIRASILQVIHTYFQYATEHSTFYRMLLSMWFAPPSSAYFPKVYTVLHDQHQILEQMFADAVKDHGNMRGRQQRYAVTFSGIINTYIGMSFQGHADLSQETLVRDVAHQFMHGLFS